MCGLNKQEVARIKAQLMKMAEESLGVMDLNDYSYGFEVLNRYGINYGVSIIVRDESGEALFYQSIDDDEMNWVLR